MILLLATQNIYAQHKSHLSQGSSLSAEQPDDLLISPNNVFTAGFQKVGNNAYCFAIWFTKSRDQTAVWMANRDYPVNGKYSELKLMDNGNVHISDAGRSIVWTSNTPTVAPVKLQILDSGNLVLVDTQSNTFLWQTFDFPTNTLLPNQLMTRNAKIISSISLSNPSSGFYKLFFDNDNVLRLLFDGPETSSIYWPKAWSLPWESGRTTYNDSRLARYDSSGRFNSTDGLQFYASDFGVGPQRRLTLDVDGNIRLYSLQENGGWEVSWIAIPENCDVHGLCGPNSLCENSPNFGRKCSCLPGFRPRGFTSYVLGCEPEFSLEEGMRETEFFRLSNTQLCSDDVDFFLNYTPSMCEEVCRKRRDCKGYYLEPVSDGIAYNCFPKTKLLNGIHSIGDSYFKVPTNYTISNQRIEAELNCVDSEEEVVLNRSYGARYNELPMKFLIAFASAVGAVELLCIFLVWCFLFRANEDPSVGLEGYVLAANVFRRYSYAEMRKATSNFSEEIGRGGSGVVYKGVLPDGKEIAIKKLDEASQGEAEFLAEVNTICRLKHMNLIELLGFCLDGKRRMLVFEFMENGSLAENVHSKSLDWGARYGIAVGAAKGLAYLHEECLEWVLHCDVKPQNILLDSEYNPKVADFGLSKLLKRDGTEDSCFSRIRGTRGYMAPEWVSNMPITAKVDVYSYGVVMLEMITGKNPNEMEQQALVAWVKARWVANHTLESWMEEIADPGMEGMYNMDEMKTMGLVALQCVEEDSNARPTMTQVLAMLKC